MRRTKGCNFMDCQMLARQHPGSCDGILLQPTKEVAQSTRARAIEGRVGVNISCPLVPCQPPQQCITFTKYASPIFSSPTPHIYFCFKFSAHISTVLNRDPLVEIDSTWKSTHTKCTEHPKQHPFVLVSPLLLPTTGQDDLSLAHFLELWCCSCFPILGCFQLRPQTYCASAMVGSPGNSAVWMEPAYRIRVCSRETIGF